MQTRESKSGSSYGSARNTHFLLLVKPRTFQIYRAVYTHDEYDCGSHILVRRKVSFSVLMGEYRMSSGEATRWLVTRVVIHQ